jgi:hypothetical protein
VGEFGIILLIEDRPKSSEPYLKPPYLCLGIILQNKV